MKNYMLFKSQDWMKTDLTWITMTQEHECAAPEFLHTSAGKWEGNQEKGELRDTLLSHDLVWWSSETFESICKVSPGVARWEKWGEWLFGRCFDGWVCWETRKSKRNLTRDIYVHFRHTAHKTSPSGLSLLGTETGFAQAWETPGLQLWTTVTVAPHFAQEVWADVHIGYWKSESTCVAGLQH